MQYARGGSPPPHLDIVLMYYNKSNLRCQGLYNR